MTFSLSPFFLGWSSSSPHPSRSLLQAHKMLCNGVSFHTLGPILSFLRFEPTSPLFGLALWSIVTSFSGCDTFLAAVRSLSPPQEYVLLSTCDIGSRCRRAIHCVHVGQLVAPLIHISADSAGARVAPWSLLVYWGYPCVLFSILNRHVTPDRLQGSIDLFDAAFSHIILRRPPVFLFENVASLLCSHLRFVIDHFLYKVDSLGGYRVHLGVLCPSEYSSDMTRPRLLVLVWQPVLRCVLPRLS